MQALIAFMEYAQSRGKDVVLVEDFVTISNVVNPGNDFKVMMMDDYYVVITIRVSKQDYEYGAKCAVYLLLAEFNGANRESKHLHINYRVDL